MKVIVTGAAGFIGSHLADRLVKEGHDVIGIDNLSTGRREFMNEDVRFIEKDLTKDYVKPYFDGVDYVFHLAAVPRLQLSIDQPLETFNNNVVATARVLECSRQAGVKRFIYASSSSVYGRTDKLPITEEIKEYNPLSPYASQKLMGEMICRYYSQVFDLDTVCLRFFNVYGPRASTTGAYKLVIAIFLEQLRAGKPLTVFGDGTQTRDFTWVEDVVDANVRAMQYEGHFNAQAFNICSGEETSVNRIAQLIAQDKLITTRNGREALLKSKITHVPNTRLAYEEQRKVGSYELAHKTFGYKPKVFIEDGIRSLIYDSILV